MNKLVTDKNRDILITVLIERLTSLEALTKTLLTFYFLSEEKAETNLLSSCEKRHTEQVQEDFDETLLAVEELIEEHGLPESYRTKKGVI